MDLGTLLSLIIAIALVAILVIIYLILWFLSHPKPIPDGHLSRAILDRDSNLNTSSHYQVIITASLHELNQTIGELHSEGYETVGGIGLVNLWPYYIEESGARTLWVQAVEKD